jgi:hypothetical protein
MGFSAATPSILRGLKLPDWNDSSQLLFPARRPSIAASFAESIAGNAFASPHAAGDWHHTIDERQKQRLAESARVAEYYKAQKREHEEREHEASEMP